MRELQSQPAYPDDPNALCNLSEGEYMREDALVKHESRRVTLAHGRICYSPESSVRLACSEEYEDRVMKGPWARDRFKVSSMPLLKGARSGRTSRR